MTQAGRDWRDRNGRGPAVTSAARERHAGRWLTSEPCHVCGGPLPRVLVDAGEYDHPTCDPSFGYLLRLSMGGPAKPRRTSRRRRR